MDKRNIESIKKRAKALGGLQKDLIKISDGLINDIEDPEIKSQLLKARSEAMKGNKSPAEQLLKNLNNK